jgi:citrate lyase beta subunit
MSPPHALPTAESIDAVAAQDRETARRALEEVCSGRDKGARRLWRFI